MGEHQLAQEIEELLARQARLVAEGRYGDICTTEKDFIAWGQRLESSHNAIAPSDLLEILKQAWEKNQELQENIKELQREAIELLSRIQTTKSDQRSSTSGVGGGRLLDRHC